jgi:hypothetical protein
MVISAMNHDQDKKTKNHVHDQEELGTMTKTWVPRIMFMIKRSQEANDGNEC